MQNIPNQPDPFQIALTPKKTVAHSHKCSLTSPIDLTIGIFDGKCLPQWVAPAVDTATQTCNALVVGVSLYNGGWAATAVSTAPLAFDATRYVFFADKATDQSSKYANMTREMVGGSASSRESLAFVTVFSFAIAVIPGAAPLADHYVTSSTFRDILKVPQTVLNYHASTQFGKGGQYVYGPGHVASSLVKGTSSASTAYRVWAHVCYDTPCHAMQDFAQQMSEDRNKLYALAVQRSVEPIVEFVVAYLHQIEEHHQKLHKRPTSFTELFAASWTGAQKAGLPNMIDAACRSTFKARIMSGTRNIIVDIGGSKKNLKAIMPFMTNFASRYSPFPELKALTVISTFAKTALAELTVTYTFVTISRISGPIVKYAMPEIMPYLAFSPHTAALVVGMRSISGNMSLTEGLTTSAVPSAFMLGSNIPLQLIGVAVTVEALVNIQLNGTVNITKYATQFIADSGRRAHALINPTGSLETYALTAGALTLVFNKVGYVPGLWQSTNIVQAPACIHGTAGTLRKILDVSDEEGNEPALAFTAMACALMPLNLYSIAFCSTSTLTFLPAFAYDSVGAMLEHAYSAPTSAMQYVCEATPQSWKTNAKNGIDFLINALKNNLMSYTCIASNIWKEELYLPVVLPNAHFDIYCIRKADISCPEEKTECSALIAQCFFESAFTTNTDAPSCQNLFIRENATLWNFAGEHISAGIQLA